MTKIAKKFDDIQSHVSSKLKDDERKTIPVQLQTSQVNLQAVIDHANYAWRSVRLYATVFYNGKCSHTCIRRIIRYFFRILKLLEFLLLKLLEFLLLKLRILAIENMNETRQALNCFSCFIHILNCKTSLFFGICFFLYFLKFSASRGFFFS